MTGGREPPAATCFSKAWLLMMMIALKSLARQKERRKKTEIKEKEVKQEFQSRRECSHTSLSVRDIECEEQEKTWMVV